MASPKLNTYLPLLFSIALALGMIIGYKLRSDMPTNRAFFSLQKHNTIQEVEDLLNSKYVDTVNIETLTDTAIQAILSKLDPHTIHIPALQVAAVNEDIKGGFYGIGIEYALINDSLNVVQVVSNGPAAKAGLAIGDIIVKAGSSSLSGVKIETNTIRTLLRGQDGSQINLSVYRNGSMLQINVARGKIPLTSLDAAYMIDSLTGYIKLNKFSATTYTEFMNGLLALKKQGLQKLILDLRGNGGGVLDEATEIADELLAGDKLITYTQGLHYPKKEYRCRREGQFEKGKLIVLVDEGSASASEVLLGALQDWDRGIIVGRPTFGKGLVQEQYSLSDNSALRLTVARYYTPIGRNIQRSYKNGTAAYYADASVRQAHSAKPNTLVADSSKIYTSQAGKKLYGSGGITPDYFVATDTTLFDALPANFYSKATITDYGYQYYKLHNKQLQGYKSAKQFINQFAISPTDWQLFETLAAKDSIATNKISPPNKKLISAALKAAIARQLFKTNGYVQAINDSDPAVKKAMELIK